MLGDMLGRLTEAIPGEGAPTLCWWTSRWPVGVYMHLGDSLETEGCGWKLCTGARAAPTLNPETYIRTLHPQYCPSFHGSRGGARASFSPMARI